MQHFQMHVYRKTDFHLLVYRHFFGQGISDCRHSDEGHQAPQTPFHQARVGKTANSLLKDGAKIHLKNRRLHKSTETCAPTIEIPPVLSPNKVMGVAKSVSLRDKLSWPSGRKSQTLKQATWKSAKVSCVEQFTALVLVDEG
jgi:hypothetical protein